jgi:uncharacterized protein YjbI with pentapeptide repeats
MAFFYRGFVYERDVSAPLTIEGRPIELTSAKRGHYAALLPSGRKIQATSIAKLVDAYIRKSGALAERDRMTKSQVKRLCRGKKVWNSWRLAHPDAHPMLASADLRSCRHLDGYDFSYTNLTQANLRGVSLIGANFHQAILAKADFSGAHLENANFCRTDLYETDFRRAHFGGANLQGVQLAKTDLRGAHISGCNVYGLSAWDLRLDDTTEQEQLRITYQRLGTGSTAGDVAIVDGVDLAAFIYMTLNNRNISRVFGATHRKWVLLLGRFSKRKSVLERLKRELKHRQYVPIIFDFSRPEQLDLIETAVLLAGMSAFVIVDITGPRSTPMELQAIAPTFGVPIVPIIGSSESEFGTFSALRKFPWVLPAVKYTTITDLIARLDGSVIEPALARAQLLGGWKAEQPPPQSPNQAARGRRRGAAKTPSARTAARAGRRRGRGRTARRRATPGLRRQQ